MISQRHGWELSCTRFVASCAGSASVAWGCGWWCCCSLRCTAAAASWDGAAPCCSCACGLSVSCALVGCAKAKDLARPAGPGTGALGQASTVKAIACILFCARKQVDTRQTRYTLNWGEARSESSRSALTSGRGWRCWARRRRRCGGCRRSAEEEQLEPWLRGAQGERLAASSWSRRTRAMRAPCCPPRSKSIAFWCASSSSSLRTDRDRSAGGGEREQFRSTLGAPRIGRRGHTGWRAAREPAGSSGREHRGTLWHRTCCLHAGRGLLRAGVPGLLRRWRRGEGGAQAGQGNRRGLAVCAGSVRAGGAGRAHTLIWLHSAPSCSSSAVRPHKGLRRRWRMMAVSRPVRKRSLCARRAPPRWGRWSCCSTSTPPRRRATTAPSSLAGARCRRRRPPRASRRVRDASLALTRHTRPQPLLMPSSARRRIARSHLPAACRRAVDHVALRGQPHAQLLPSPARHAARAGLRPRGLCVWAVRCLRFRHSDPC